ncbi:MAG: aryl-sulfate sulfotransferase [Deltaproteobacteria bacterium]|nr:aryl-sulfate sulfotransferase [Deltaproteobacteria bacterium]
MRGHRQHRPSRAGFALAGLAVVAVWACTPQRQVDDGDTGSEGGDAVTQPCGPTRIDMSPSPVVPTVAHVSWSSQEPSTGRVEFGLKGALDRAVLSSDQPATHHEVRLLGLKAGRTYTYRVITSCLGESEVRSEVAEIGVPPPPPDLPRLSLVQYEPQLAMPGGYRLLTQIEEQGTWIVILDDELDYVWWYLEDGPDLAVFTARPAASGQGLTYIQEQRNPELDTSWTLGVSMVGNETSATCTEKGHHDFVELPDGQVAFISWDLRWVEVEGSWEYVEGDAIRENPSGSRTCADVVEVFNFFDDYGHEPWPASPTYYDYAGSGGADWTHANSLVYDAEDDAYYLMARNLSALLKIDRATGDILWQMGGEYGDFDFAHESDRWSHAHFSLLWDGGMVIFDNGLFVSTPGSRLAEYAWDEEARTVEVVWEYRDSEGTMSPAGGDVRVLPNGNYLATWGALGRFTEITPDGEVAMLAESPLGAVTGRVTWLEDL